MANPELGFIDEKKADFTATNKDSCTPLYLAVLNDNLDIVKFLAEKGADINAADKNGNTPLHRAARNSEFNIIEFLLKRGADVNAANKDGMAPLHLAAEKGTLGVVKLLVEKGADVEASDKDSKTPLHCAVVLDKSSLLSTKYLGSPGKTSLHKGAEDNHLDIVKFLVGEGAVGRSCNSKSLD